MSTKIAHFAFRIQQVAWWGEGTSCLRVVGSFPTQPFVSPALVSIQSEKIDCLYLIA